MHDNFLRELNWFQNKADGSRKALEITQERDERLPKVPEKSEVKNKVATGQPKDNDSRLVAADSKQIYDALASVSPQLARSYEQIKNDIEDSSRLSWAGTAHEIREILSHLLRTLAPSDEVEKQNWFKREDGTSGPTQKQRVIYIIKQHDAGSKEKEVVERVVDLEDRLGTLVRTTYSRASDAAHRIKGRVEVRRILRYFEAFAFDLLDLD